MTSVEDDRYEYDPFDDGSSKMVGERLAEATQDFVEDYKGQLREMEEAMGESLSDVWDSTVDPIGLAIEAYEQTTIMELVRTDNKHLSKVLLVFAALCSEARSLVRMGKENFYTPLLLFGEEATGEDDASEGEVQEQVGRMLNPFLMDLSKYVHRVYAVVQNFVRQLASLYAKGQRLYASSFKSIHLTAAFEHLGSLLGVLVTLDEIVRRNEALQAAWAKYKRMARFCKAAPEKYGVSEDRLELFEKLLLTLEGQLFGGALFAGAMEQEFDYPGVVSVRKNEVMRAELMSNIKAIYLGLAARLGGLEEEDLRYNYLGMCCLYVLYHTVYGDVPDKVFFRQLFELYKVVPVVHLCGNVAWSAPPFFAEYARSALQTIPKLDVRRTRAEILKQLDAGFAARVEEMHAKTARWMARMESNLSNRANTREILSTRVTLVAHGPALAYRLANLFKTVTHMHVSEGVAINRTITLSLFRCVEMLKGIEATFHRCSAMIGESLSYMVQVTSSELQRLLIPLKRKLEGARKMNDAMLDALAAVVLALKMLNGPLTRDREMVLRLCLEVVFQQGLVADRDVEGIRIATARLQAEGDIVRKIRDACDANWFYWSRELMPFYYRHLYMHPEMAHHLHYVFAALRDVIPLLRQTVHTEPHQFLEAYKQQVDEAFREGVLEPLCRDIETDLRLHVHAHMNVEKNRDPFRNGVKDLAGFCKVKPIRFFDTTIDIPAFVAHYLDTTFYNLNTCALYDWKTYAEMRSLAEEKYGLRMTDVHLPGATLEQGLDVLEIMRNIHIFVAKYCYNLNQQMFIQRHSEQNKTLSTISINHISNSIRTHGLGILNTTVNFTYQFLRQKFAVFSQFLYDDHIKSRLFRDMRFFRENRVQLDGCYPYERAERFNKDIRKLGTTDAGLTYLDQFRGLVTEIGNAMGYIRMIRSGGLNYTANAIKFVPDLVDIPPFEELARAAGATPPTTDACRNLDSAVGSLSRNFSQGTEYFKMLVNVFAREFRDERNAHLRNFYIIIPPLTVNFVENSLLQKDKMGKKGGSAGGGGSFCDDGFALGLAYILKLLAQQGDFDSLHWWSSVQDRYAGEMKKLELMADEFKKAGRSADDERTRALTLRKLDTHRAEYELLQWSFESSCVFFNYGNDDLKIDNGDNDGGYNGGDTSGDGGDGGDGGDEIDGF